MTDEEKTERERRKEELKKLRTLFDLYNKVRDPFIRHFFDIGSDKMIDEKIEFLEAIAAGVALEDIPNRYDILELYPKDSDMPWDL